METYRPRLIDRELNDQLDAFGAVLIEGPKWCGKTTSAKQKARSAIYMQDEDNSRNYLELAKDTPSALLKGEKPRLIDEWQMAPNLWDAVRFSIDQTGEPGQYILTGSVTLDKSEIKHSGTGRITRLRMRTMSLWESGDSTGEVSLQELFRGAARIEGKSEHDIFDLARILVRGGWPASIGRTERTAHNIVAGYCKSILDTEMATVDGKRRDPIKMRSILRSLARNSATAAPDTKILHDITAFGEYDGLNGKELEERRAMDIKTARDYIGLLDRMYVTEDLEAWNPRLRSETAIRTGRTRHFSDPAVAAYFLGSSAEDLVYDMGTFGPLFESMVIRDLRVYAQALEGEVYHYRDSDGREADAVIHLWNGKWGAIEVKLNPAREDEGATNLLKLVEKVDTEAMHPPSFLAVVTGRGFAHTRADGVHVIPIGCLRDRHPRMKRMGRTPTAPDPVRGFTRSCPRAGTSCRGSSR